MSMPTLLGRYPVRRRLGSGAFATVWLAHDEQLDCPVAVKVLADNWSGDGHVRRRFVEEGRFLRKVESPYVVPVYDAGELPDGRPFLVMAYADQGTLAERLEQGPLDRAQALQVVREIGAGLQALHARGVLHRDVKPGNVLLRSDEGRVRAMLADLGLGKELDVSSRLTMIAGTPSYVAPEQARGERLDGRADQFSLAALAHLLLTGRPAWTHATLSAAADPPALAPMDEVSPEVAEVLLRGLAADREDRYDSVSELTAALVAAAGETADAPVAWAPVQHAPWVGSASGDGGSTDDVGGSTEGHEPPTALAVDDPGRRRPFWLKALVAALAVVVGLAAGWALATTLGGDADLVDADDTLSVTVPHEWTTSVQDGGWTPPGADRSYSALAAGTGADWREEGEGVFLGLLPGSDLPLEVPGHPDCEDEGTPVQDEQDGDASVTVAFTGCPGPATVVVERVVRVTTNRLLWVQVRAADRATANRVLDTVDVHGM